MHRWRRGRFIGARRGESVQGVGDMDQFVGFGCAGAPARIQGGTAFIVKLSGRFLLLPRDVARYFVNMLRLVQVFGWCDPPVTFNGRFDSDGPGTFAGWTCNRLLIVHVSYVCASFCGV